MVTHWIHGNVVLPTQSPKHHGYCTFKALTWLFHNINACFLAIFSWNNSAHFLKWQQTIKQCYGHNPVWVVVFFWKSALAPSITVRRAESGLEHGQIVWMKKKNGISWNYCTKQCLLANVVQPYSKLCYLQPNLRFKQNFLELYFTDKTSWWMVSRRHTLTGGGFPMTHTGKG